MQLILCFACDENQNKKWPPCKKCLWGVYTEEKIFSRWNPKDCIFVNQKLVQLQREISVHQYWKRRFLCTAFLQDLPEIVSARNFALFGDAVKPTERITGNAMLPRMIQITHPSNLDSYYPTLCRKAQL